MTAHALGPRRLPSWTDGFLEWSEQIRSPEIFRKWGAITTIAAALERKVWTFSDGANLYPNLYVVLVGPPGVGKSKVFNRAEALLRAVPTAGNQSLDLQLAPSSVTTAALADVLKDSTRRIIRPTENPSFVEFNYVTVLASELGNFLPVYESSFMNMLTKVYDGEEYSERRRTKELKLKIAHPQMTLFGATTPSYLNAFMPEGAWDQGFISRTILVYSADKVPGSLWTKPEEGKRLEQLHIDLINDLRAIAGLFGMITWDKEAREAIDAWNLSGGLPLPEHSRLIHYNTRRVAHLIKLCMIAAVNTGSALAVSLRDFECALEWLIEAETYMPELFNATLTSGDASIMDNTWNFGRSYAKRIGREWIPTSVVINFVRERAPAHNVLNILRVMVNSRMMEMNEQDNSCRMIAVAKEEGPLLRALR